MNATANKIPALVRAELEAANRVNEPFHNAHEGYAVLLEELEEAKEALEEAEVCLKMMWQYIRRDLDAGARDYAQRLEQHAEHLIGEATQVAAMAQKFQKIKEGAQKI